MTQPPVKPQEGEAQSPVQDNQSIDKISFGVAEMPENQSAIPDRLDHE